MTAREKLVGMAQRYRERNPSPILRHRG